MSGGTSGVASGSDGNVWFTEAASGAIGRITPTGTITSFPANANGDVGIAAGPDGNLWFTGWRNGEIGQVTTSGTVTTFESGSDARRIVTGPDGNLWFTESLGQAIGRLVPSQAVPGTSTGITHFSAPGDGFPFDITAGPDGDLWFTEQYGQVIDRITTSGAITEFPISNDDVLGITAGPDGNVWFAARSESAPQLGAIGRVTPSGTVTEFPVAGGPSGITAGPDGDVWFTESIGNRIGRIAPNGAITEYPIPGDRFGPWMITTGPDGNVWFAGALGVGRVGLVAVGGSPTVTSVQPDHGSVAGGTKVTIRGLNFAAGARVLFGSTPATSVTVTSSSQLNAIAPAGAPGSVNVTVQTNAGTSAITTNDLYAYGPPAIASFAPDSGITGSRVTITGSAFARGTVVSFGSLISPRMTLLSGTQLRATVPNGDRPSALTVSLGQGSATSTSEFIPTFSITGFGPRVGPPGTTVVTVDGVGFNSSSVVKFNGVAAATKFLSSSRLRATVPARATTGPISVTNTAAPVGTVRSRSRFRVSGSLLSWDLARDMQADALLAHPLNPFSDSSGNAGVWELMLSAGTARDPSTYSDMTFVPSNCYPPGVYLWNQGAGQSPWGGAVVNTTGTTAQTPCAPNQLLPPHSAFLHPGPSNDALVAWHSPISGVVSVRVGVSDADCGGGDGVAWYIDRERTELASGSFTNCGSETLLPGQIGVRRGTTLYFLIDPNADYGFDLTELDLTIDEIS